MQRRRDREGRKDEIGRVLEATSAEPTLAPAGRQARLLSSPMAEREQAKRQEQERQKDHMPSGDNEHEYYDSDPYRKQSHGSNRS
jgi:hypothetical protein